MLKNQITIHTSRDENDFQFHVHIPEDKAIRELLKSKLTLNELCPKLSFVDQLLNGDFKLECSGVSFELGMMGSTYIAVCVLNDGKRSCTFYMHEDDIQISDISFMYDSNTAISITKESEEQNKDQLESISQDPVLTVECMNLIFEFKAYQEFLLSSLNICFEENSVKKCNKIKVKALRALIEQSIDFDSPLNTKSNKKALGYLLKAPKQIMLIVSEALIDSYNKS